MWKPHSRRRTGCICSGSTRATVVGRFSIVVLATTTLECDFDYVGGR
jgi:hypothetical protein